MHRSIDLTISDVISSWIPGWSRPWRIDWLTDSLHAVKDGHGNLRGEEVEIWDPTAEGEPPPPLPDTPSRIPYATPPIAEEEEEPPPERKLGEQTVFLD